MRRLIILVALLLPPALWGHDHEPINTEFAAPFSRGAGNVQFGYQWFTAPADQLLPIQFEYGFAPRMQVGVALPFINRDEGASRVMRPGNPDLEFRYLLAGGNERKFALSINPGISIPAGDKRVAERAWSIGAALHLDTHLAGRFWTHTNLGYETPVARFEQKDKNFIYKTAAMYELTEQIHPVVEVIGVHEFQTGRTETALVPELIFAPSHHWEIKAGIPTGLTSSTPDVGVQLQLTWKFGKGEGRQ